jgi:hypothetical protein
MLYLLSKSRVFPPNAVHCSSDPADRISGVRLGQHDVHQDHRGTRIDTHNGLEPDLSRFRLAHGRGAAPSGDRRRGNIVSGYLEQMKKYSTASLVPTRGTFAFTCMFADFSKARAG